MTDSPVYGVSVWLVFQELDVIISLRNFTWAIFYPLILGISFS